MLHVQYISIDDFLIATTQKKRHGHPLVDLAHHRVGANCRLTVEPLHDLMTAQMVTRLTLRSFKRENRKVSYREVAQIHKSHIYTSYGIFSIVDR